MERIGHYIGGKLVPSESGRRGPVFDPATGAQTTSRWPDPSTSTVDLGFPRTRLIATPP